MAFRQPTARSKGIGFRLEFRFGANREFDSQFAPFVRVLPGFFFSTLESVEAVSLWIDFPGLLPPFQLSVPSNEREILALQFEQDSDLVFDWDASLFPVPVGLGPKERSRVVPGRVQAITHDHSRATECCAGSAVRRACRDRCLWSRATERHVPVVFFRPSETQLRSGVRVV